MNKSIISSIFSVRLIEETYVIKLRNGVTIFKHVNYINKIAESSGLSVSELLKPKTEIMYELSSYKEGQDYHDSDGSVAGQHSKDGTECTSFELSIPLPMEAVEADVDAAF